MSDKTAEKQNTPLTPNYRLAGLPMPSEIIPSKKAVRRHDVMLLSEKILLEIIGRVSQAQVLDEEAQDEIIKICQSMAEKFISANEQKEGETNGL